MDLKHRIDFTIHGRPVPKPRPRMTRTGHVFTPKRGKEFEQLVATEFYRANGGTNPCEGPIEVIAEFIYKAPRGVSSGDRIPRIATPDIDNVLKSILDGLNKVAFADDKQVFKISAEMYYGEEDKTEVSIRYYE